MTITAIQVVNTAKALGNGRPYVLDTVGPDSYDCSGLVYTTLKQLGLYNGPRFSTRDFARLSAGIVSAVSAPAVGDIVLWSAHMGIVDGPNTFYSAYSPARGILDTSLSGFSRTPGFPRYYRLNAYTPTISVGSHSGVPVPVPAPVTTPITLPVTTSSEDDNMLPTILWCYTALMGRAATPEEVVFQLEAAQSWTPARFIETFLNQNAEPSAHVKAYQDILHRDPVQADIDLRAGMSIRQVRAELSTAAVAGAH